ncbi:MazG-like family protein [Candidatus Bathyarchaeota archaeon]|nr:MazG-like family protein [Candidatus Bathyarchaeota archaeon]
MLKDLKKGIENLRTLSEAQGWIKEREENYYKFLDTRDIIICLGKEIGEFYKAYVNKEVYPDRWWGGAEGAESMGDELADVLNWCLVLSNRLKADLCKVIGRIEGFKEKMTPEEIQDYVRDKYPKETSTRQILLRIGGAFGDLCGRYLELKIKPVELLPGIEKVALWCFSMANAIGIDLFEAWKNRPIPGR